MTEEREGFRQDLIRLLPELRAFARFLTRDPTAADDLVQDTLLRALRNEAQWAPGTSLKAWTFTILRNAFLEARRKAGARQRLLDSVTMTEATPAGQEARMELAGLAQALSTLPREQQEAIVLVGALGLSSEEAAAVAGVAVGTLKARVSRGRRVLGTRFERPLEDS
ncbi:sigma-70 family RNA polymerase sigma factor [Roseomonas sp. CCTCC AB2023176]|uniref:sigma-70 family RNA polymerase sigma factor n=1 Tax=Roseomonas sp. CCTCC AB2023176 TaxID=3342640 RepID=UPI0035D5F6BB